MLKTRARPGPFSASDLAVAAGRPLLARQSFEPGDLDEIILGCVMPAPEEANIGRVAALRLDIDERVPAWQVQRNCGSGMQAVDSAMRNIEEGRCDLVLAGGTESMSHAPVLVSRDMVEWLGDWSGARRLGERLRLLGRLRPRHFRPVLALLRGLTDHTVGLSMGQTAENLAHRFRITREAMDAFALESHRRLADAQDHGRLAEIETIFDTQGHYYGTDDGLRRDSDMQKLARLKPAFDRPFGQVTAGNSAQVTDGAAWVVLASEIAVKRHRLTPKARLIDSEWAGVDPAQMGLGPVHAMVPLLKRHKLKADAIDYWEINEAFAAQVLACLEAFKDRRYLRETLRTRDPLGEIDPERLNVDGGAVSIGHPVGMSGARLVLHMMNVLEHHQARRGVASLCIGGGQGGAMLLERDGG